MKKVIDICIKEHIIACFIHHKEHIIACFIHHKEHIIACFIHHKEHTGHVAKMSD